MFCLIFILVSYFVTYTLQLDIELPYCQYDISYAREAGIATSRFMIKVASAMAHESSENNKTNTVFSPVSIILALALLQAGASGETLDKLYEITADLTENQQDLHQYQKNFHSLQFLLFREKPVENLYLANGLFYNKDFGINPGFERILKYCYDAEPMMLHTNRYESRDLVNKFISNATNGKIIGLYPKESIEVKTKLVLASALAMHIPWQYQFESTESGSFYRYENLHDIQRVTYARIKAKFTIWDHEGYTAVVLPLAGQELEMTLLKKKEDEKEKDPENKNAIFEIVSAKVEPSVSKKVDLSIPMFSIRYKVDLVPILKAIGLENIFSDEAIFDKMTESKAALSKAMHEAWIKVEYKGVENAPSIDSTEKIESTHTLKFDKPFMFFVSHKSSGAPLFFGQVNYIQN